MTMLVGMSVLSFHSAVYFLSKQGTAFQLGMCIPLGTYFPATKILINIVDFFYLDLLPVTNRPQIGCSVFSETLLIDYVAELFLIGVVNFYRAWNKQAKTIRTPTAENKRSVKPIAKRCKL